MLQLSSMLRTLLQGVRSSSWPLAQELELVRTLFALHHLRSPSAFRQRQLEAASQPAELMEEE